METDSSKLHLNSAEGDQVHPVGPPAEEGSGMDAGQRKAAVIAVVIAAVVLAATGLGVWFLLQPTTDTARIRDVFIIFLALQSVLMGVALIVLIIQVARLIVLLQNEIKPILDSTNETVSSLRGTTIFLSDNLVEPVIKMNEYLAGVSQLIAVLGLGKKARRNSSR